MKKYVFFILAGIVLCPSFLSAQEEMTFEAYTNGAKAFCDNEAQPWNSEKNGGSTNAGIPAYPNLTPDDILESITSTTANEQVGAFREKLEKALSRESIARFRGFKTLEVARIQYRNAMDHTFSCSVISSRIKTLDTLTQTLQKTLGEKSSEIQNKLKREREKMNALLESIGDCGNLGGNVGIPLSKKLVNTASRQYCHYGKYLEFLTNNLSANTAKIQQMEASLEGSTQTKSIQNTIEWERDLSLRQEQLDKEWLRAQKSLPRAFTAFREMERTYGMHLMLVILYDDYVRLRDNLSTHFNSISQLLEKAYNAQNPNK